MIKEVINTKEAPQAIGTYSQAICAGNTVYISGQIPLDPASMTLVEGDIPVHIHQVFKNLDRVVHAAGGTLDAIVKLTIYLTDLAYFPTLNSIMADYFHPPYPARAVIQVAALPKHAAIEMDAILVLNN